MNICVLGHPYAPIGTGEQLTSFLRGLDECNIEYRLFDIYGAENLRRERKPQWLLDKETFDSNYGDIRIFHINGDEIIPCLEHLEKKGMKFDSQVKNIIIPAWELPVFPEIWRKPLNRFDEVWALSGYIKKMFSDWAKPVIRYVGQSAERDNGILYPRKFFGIKDSALVFLSFFDESSFIARKNPEAIIEFYRCLRDAHPHADFQLVLKIKNHGSMSVFEVNRIDENVVLINENLTYEKMTSLIDVSDIFISLHRAEGFGRGAAESVLRRKRAIVTNYSGVEDYTADPAILPVDYTLVTVEEGEYPHGTGQVWAEPHIKTAVDYGCRLIEEHKNGKTNEHFFRTVDQAGMTVRNVASNLRIGVNVLENLGHLN